MDQLKSITNIITLIAFTGLLIVAIINERKGKDISNNDLMWIILLAIWAFTDN